MGTAHENRQATDFQRLYQLALMRQQDERVRVEKLLAENEDLRSQLCDCSREREILRRRIAYLEQLNEERIR